MNLRGNGHSDSSPVWRTLLLVLAALLAVVLLVRIGDRLLGDRQTVLVATRDLAAGSVATPDVLREETLRTSSIPPRAATPGDRPQIEGRQLARVVRAGAPLVPDDFVPLTTDAGSVSKLVPPGRVLMTLQVAENAAPFPELRRGDRVNVVGVAPTWHGSVAHDAHILGWIKPEAEEARRGASTLFGVDLTPPTAPRRGETTLSLLLGVRPVDVVPLSQAQAVGARLTVVIHGRREVAEGHLLDLTGPRAPQVELITGGEREMVDLRR